MLHEHDGAGSDVLHVINDMGSFVMVCWRHTARAVPHVWASKLDEWTYLGIWIVNLQTSGWSIQKDKAQLFYQDQDKAIIRID